MHQLLFKVADVQNLIPTSKNDPTGGYYKKDNIWKLTTQYKSCFTDADALGEGVGSMRRPADKGEGGGVKNWQNFADVFYGWPVK